MTKCAIRRIARQADARDFSGCKVNSFAEARMRSIRARSRESLPAIPLGARNCWGGAGS